jgi:hypothetical protein
MQSQLVEVVAKAGWLCKDPVLVCFRRPVSDALDLHKLIAVNCMVGYVAVP